MDLESNFIFNPHKNTQLILERKISFEEVIFHIENNKIIDIFPHHNSTKYPEQWILVIDINNYAYQVPFKYEDNKIRLITIFPSRKYTKLYLSGENHDKTK